MFKYPDTKKDQIIYCINKSPEHLIEFIPEAFNRFTKKKPFDLKYCNEIIQDAGYLYSEGKEKIIQRRKRESEDFVLISTPESRIKAKELIKKIIPEIQELRKELFGKKDPPFSEDLDKAIKWLKNKAKEEARPFFREAKRNKREISVLEEELKMKLKKLSKLTYRNCELSIEKDLLLPFPLKIKDKFITDYLYIWPGTSLAMLEGRTRFFSWQTRFNQQDLIIFILTGIESPPLTYKKSFSRTVKLEIYRNLNYKEFISLFHEINKFLKVKGKQFTEDHEILLNLLEEFGPIPKKGKKKFWEKILKELNERYDKKYNDWNGPRIAYHRIVKRKKLTDLL